MYKVLICGSRYYSDYRKILDYVRGLKSACIISGAARRGADSLAIKAARACGLAFKEYPANWACYGKAAGPIRNAKMLEVERPDLVVAFHEDISLGKGTRDMVARARRCGVPVIVIR